MAGIGKAEETFLSETFGDRVTFSERERRMYSRDIAAMPSLFRPVVGKTLPDAVVQPGDEAELAALIRWACEKGIPLTPRGKATSGYGGVLPVRRGIVVDFYRMRRILKVDPEGLTVTVEAGIVWERLDEELARQGLTLRLYPSSYPSATAGGWLAQGGAGIGSYEFGWFSENVVSARAVLPSGEIRTFEGADLDLVSEAEGITGFVSSLTLRVMPREELGLAALSLPSAGKLQEVASAIVEADLPIWSFLFINPKMAELKNKAPLRTHAGRIVEERVDLPRAYIATAAFRQSDRDAVTGKLGEIVAAAGGKMLDPAVAEHEWNSRFNLMVVKRLGPSLVPAEVVVPLEKLGPVLGEVEDKIAQPVIKEGVVVRRGRGGKPEVVILGFIPSDQRKFGYNFVFGLSLTLMKIARGHGGRPYSTGLYFAHMADEILGPERAEKLRSFKREVDPRDLLNPRKVLRNGLVGLALGLARFFEPVARLFGNAVSTEVGERPIEPVRGIPADVAWFAYACSSCGYCIDTCDQFYGRGWESQTPRGKWAWLRDLMEGREKWDQEAIDTMLVCTTCEMCDLRCSAALPIEPSWMKLRGKLIHEEKKMTFPPFEMMAAALADQGNIWAGYRKGRTEWFPQDLRERHGPGNKASSVYFAGCTASYVEKDIAIASVRLLDEAGVDFTILGDKENCCATPMLVAGKWDLFAEVMKENIANVKAAGADTVLSSCPACDMMWRRVYPEWAKKLGIEYDIKARHYSEVISEKLRKGEFSFPTGEDGKVKVTWHDSCHIGRASGVYDPPRDLIRAVPSADFREMAHVREDGHCCGSVLTLIKEPEVAADIGEVRLAEAVEAGAEKVLALCPCCEFQLRVTADKKKLNVEVEDLAHFAARALGHELPDPHPEVRAQWAVFEKMIALMTPAGFAAIMETMWPELIGAMPFKMGAMMRLMGRIPGALVLMRPLFPLLFPILLPMMMPKVLPTMLERIKERVPMPDYMAEQMPTMMPVVMGELMPHMIGDVVPLVTGPMIAHLRGRHPAVRK
jgi:Fe-S oxidoreductase/FAD/FMN-containing dehydrogenase